MLPDQAKFTVCSIIKLATFDETSIIGQRQKAPNSSAFHCSQHHLPLVSILLPRG